MGWTGEEKSNANLLLSSGCAIIARSSSRESRGFDFRQLGAHVTGLICAESRVDVLERGKMANFINAMLVYLMLLATMGSQRIPLRRRCPRRLALIGRVVVQRFK